MTGVPPNMRPPFNTSDPEYKLWQLRMNCDILNQDMVKLRTENEQLNAEHAALQSEAAKLRSENATLKLQEENPVAPNRAYRA
eukprot:1767415-Amphidinium_carterae.1